MTLHNDDDLMKELLQTFHEEAADHLQTLNQDLLKLERQPDEKEYGVLLRSAFRAAHSLKGAARAVNMSDIETISHHMEDILKLARDGSVALDAKTCDTLYNALDGIESILGNEAVNVASLVADLEQISAVANQEKPELPEQPEDPVIEAVETTMAEEPVIQTVETEIVNTEEHPTTSETRFNENDETIRVTISKLDALMAQAGELIVTRISAEQRANELQAMRRQAERFPRLWQDVRNRLGKMDTGDERYRNLVDTLDIYHEAIEQLLADVTNIDTLINRDSLRLGMVTERLQDEMRRVRMVPFRNLEATLQRTVRDAARLMNNQVELKLEGGDVELDKKVLELLKDPLLHLVRNSVSHGIESPEVRQKNGKPVQGTIRVTITQRGSEAHVTVSDDGQGFQLEELRKVNQATQNASDDDDLIALAFMSGVTTAANVSTISGRGVGLDVVRQQVEDLQGRISVDNRIGQGVSIQLIVPVSLAMTRVLLVSIGQKRYALPLASVEKIITPEDTFRVEGQVMLSVNGKPLPLVSLSHLLHDTASDSDDPLVIILGSAEQRIALMVDDVLTEQELAVKPFSKPLKRIKNLVGAALQGNGEPVVVLNVADIVKSSRTVRSAGFVSKNNHSKVEEAKKQDHILVVDDSITTRTLEKNILQAAGYWVETATDGIEAMNMLREQEIQLVVADIEMPNMDGISLTQKLRQSQEYQELPIILVTSLESKEDRERGMLAGANAYIVKRGFNQAELLSTIHQFL